MKRTLILSFLVALGAGCGGGGDDLVSGAKSFKDKICKCDSEACVDKVGEEYEQWRKKQWEARKGKKLEGAEREAIDKNEEEMEACVKSKGFE